MRSIKIYILEKSALKVSQIHKAVDIINDLRYFIEESDQINIPENFVFLNFRDQHERYAESKYDTIMDAFMTFENQNLSEADYKKKFTDYISRLLPLVDQDKIAAYVHFHSEIANPKRNQSDTQIDAEFFESGQILSELSEENMKQLSKLTFRSPFNSRKLVIIMKSFDLYRRFIITGRPDQKGYVTYNDIAAVIGSDNIYEAKFQGWSADETPILYIDYTSNG